MEMIVLTFHGKIRATKIPKRTPIARAMGAGIRRSCVNPACELIAKKKISDQTQKRNSRSKSKSKSNLIDRMKSVSAWQYEKSP